MSVLSYPPFSRLKSLVLLMMMMATAAVAACGLQCRAVRLSPHAATHSLRFPFPTKLAAAAVSLLRSSAAPRHQYRLATLDLGGRGHTRDSSHQRTTRAPRRGLCREAFHPFREGRLAPARRGTGSKVRESSPLSFSFSHAHTPHPSLPQTPAAFPRFSPRTWPISASGRGIQSTHARE